MDNSAEEVGISSQNPLQRIDSDGDVGKLKTVQGMDNKRKIEATITVTSGSEFQHRHAEQMIKAATSAIADVHQSRHEQNQVEVTIKLIPPHGIKNSQRKSAGGTGREPTGKE